MSLEHTADALLQRATDAGDVPGVVALVSDRKGSLYEGAFGVRTVGQDAPMTLDTVGWIASMTKALTSTAAMQLVEQGRLELDAPASRWLPRLAEAGVLEGFDDAGQPRLRPPKRPITLRHLLTHTAGFSYEFWDAEIQRFQEVTGTPAIISCEEAALRTPLKFDPGERWNYGINIDWAGRLVETVSGQKLGAYLQQHLLGPLGMKDTAFFIRPDMRARLAPLHSRGADGSLVPGEVEIPQQPENEMGGGGLYGTAPDYLRFLRMLLNHGELDGVRVLKAQTVDEMNRHQIGDVRVTMLPTANPDLTRDAEFFPGVAKGWGLAYQVNLEPAPTGRPAGGLMWAGLSNCYYWLDPQNGLAGVYLTQILPFGDVKSLPLFYEFETAVYATR